MRCCCNCCLLPPFPKIKKGWTRRSRRNNKITLLLVGLDNAGKTSTARVLVGDTSLDVAPTVGFSTSMIKYSGIPVHVYDIGGGPHIRGIWHNYYAEVHAVMFVVDASDTERLTECKEVLRDLLGHEQLSGKPMLLLANKQDKDDALDEMEIVERLDLESLVNAQKCPTRVETCSATAHLRIDDASKKKKKKKIDPGIKEGFKWLVDTVVERYAELDARVGKDVAKLNEIRCKDKEERAKRIKQNRLEERRDSSWVNGSIGDSGTDVMPIVGDPFKPIELIRAEFEKQERTDSGHRSTSSSSTVRYIQVHSSADAPAVADVEPISSSVENLVTPNRTNHTPTRRLSQENGLSVTKLIQEQLVLEGSRLSSAKKRLPTFRKNKTAPMPMTDLAVPVTHGQLPPLKTHTTKAPVIPTWLKTSSNSVAPTSEDAAKENKDAHSNPNVK